MRPGFHFGIKIRRALNYANSCKGGMKLYWVNPAPLYCDLPALGRDSASSTISPSLHICAAPTASRAHRSHTTTGHTSRPEPYSHRPTHWSASRPVWPSDSPPYAIHRLHCLLGMLPYQERARFTKGGTTRTGGWITPIGRKAGQITGGELRRTEGYLGKIPCIKESLYPCRRESTSTLSATLTS